MSVNHLIGKFAYVVHGIGNFVEGETNLAHGLEFAEEFKVSELLHILHGLFEHAQILEERCSYEFPLFETLIGEDEANLKT